MSLCVCVCVRQQNHREALFVVCVQDAAMVVPPLRRSRIC